MTIDKDIIKQSFKDYQECEPVDGGGFTVEPMNKCIDEVHQLPPLVPLYPNIVLEGDLCIIFGQSGIGKTIFAMQIARHIAENGKRVLYVDCEMTPRQLGNRYETANFPPTFLRAEMDREHPTEDVLKGIEEVAAANHVEVVFIDNITALGQSLDRGYRCWYSDGCTEYPEEEIQLDTGIAQPHSQDVLWQCCSFSFGYAGIGKD